MVQLLVCARPGLPMCVLPVPCLSPASALPVPGVCPALPACAWAGCTWSSCQQIKYQLIWSTALVGGHEAGLDVRHEVLEANHEAIWMARY